MTCYCGDMYCPSCGPAQGNGYCWICGAWDADGGCADPAACAAKEKELNQEILDYTLDPAPIQCEFIPGNNANKEPDSEV